MLTNGLRKDTRFSEAESDSGPGKICYFLRKKSARSVVSNAYFVLLALSSTRLGRSESYQNFESISAATDSKLNAHASNIKPESFRLFML